MIQQQCEWDEAQKIVISMDLVEAAKKHIKFLEVVDDEGNLYDGPALEKAIFRYKYYWLPLLAKHTESNLQEVQLVIPLDCEWIWHCHRLNPVRYVADCKKLFGRILDPGHVVVSSIEGTCKKYTQEIWEKEYPNEPYELDSSDDLKNYTHNKLATLPSTDYDLVLAVERQSSFIHKVSSTTFKDDLVLEEANKRYKGFLHLVRRNMEMKLNNPCVPTYDIDLMWHTHQLHPFSYCNDVLALVGEVLHHDDTDIGQNKGGKLDVDTEITTRLWEEMFGSIYLRELSKCRSITMGMEGEGIEMISKCKVPCITQVGWKGDEGDKLIQMISRCKCKCISQVGWNDIEV